MSEAGKSGPDQLASHEKQTSPIKCHTREHRFGRKNEVSDIFIESDDPRFERVKEVYKKLHPEGYGMGVSTETYDPGFYPSLDEARTEAARMIEQVAASDFLERLEAEYAKYLAAEKALEEARERLLEIMPRTTNY